MGQKTSKRALLTGEIDPSDPTDAWNKLQNILRVTPVVPMNPEQTPKQPNTTRFVCISDTHSLHSHMNQLPDGDVLIHAGDFTNVGLQRDVESFVEWFTALPHRHKILIAGNHDLTFDIENYLSKHWKRFHTRYTPEPFDPLLIKSIVTSCKDLIYLEDQAIELEGFKIYGSPWQPEFCSWAFNLDRGEDMQKKWDLIPDKVDILITHGPPLGHGDLCVHGGRAGCVNLLRTIEERIKPKYHIFGHIHEGYGVTTNGTTVFINASTCNVSYDRNQLNPPIVFDLPNPTSAS